ncbi:nicotinate phosphoribosyltransferase [Arthroderma uncinatum]|uniref:nicotinate phosphoribosyltransferase n=1 Tax=Arthroderma uncinatum TaxID=74035 RepID=UPI00144A7FDD|nr:nicotinate phosphoribosyltransferase [Arthroderma uncinatum]KAF3480609.1 nicotinate phosphoribosyltransferase [Arthroderma uncinatum]
MGPTSPPPPPEGVFSLLDTDLYKLTMQCATLKYFPNARLQNITLTNEELEFLQKRCPYLNTAYLRYLSEFRLKPSEQLEVSFIPIDDTGSKEDIGEVKIAIKGLWVETILYEIPLLALTSEAYFKFCDRDWDYHQQEEKAFRKGCRLLEHGCIFSEFGTRRRRDYHTQNLVMEGLTRAAKQCAQEGFKGKLSGTSNVHFAMKYDVEPVGTVAHEWYMGIAAITNDYENANEIALRYWLGCFGEGVLGIALTDTFGTPTFLDAFSKPVPGHTAAAEGPEATLPSSGNNTAETDSLASTKPPIHAHVEDGAKDGPTRTYAQVFAGVRQDSGDPVYFVKMVEDFYDKQGIKDKKTVVFSDSLNIELCLEYKVIAEESGFQPTFGVGTFFTNDFKRSSDGGKSVPLNIVIKVSSAGGRPAVKLSDNLGKNTGDSKTVVEVKKRLGYVEHDWEAGDETARWGKKGE